MNLMIMLVSLHPLLALVGRGGLEPPTSRLSGVRSNHLSYRPPSRSRARPGIGQSGGRRGGAAAQTARRTPKATSLRILLSYVKGHEDGSGLGYATEVAAKLPHEDRKRS